MATRTEMWWSQHCLNAKFIRFFSTALIDLSATLPLWRGTGVPGFMATCLALLGVSWRINWGSPPATKLLMERGVVFHDLPVISPAVPAELMFALWAAHVAAPPVLGHGEPTFWALFDPQAVPHLLLFFCMLLLLLSLPPLMTCQTRVMDMLLLLMRTEAFAQLGQRGASSY